MEPTAEFDIEVSRVSSLPILQPDAEKRLSNLKRIAGDSEFKKLTESFISNCEERAKLLNIAIVNRDFASVSFEAHSLRGGASNFAALRLSELCSAAEVLGEEKDVRVFQVASSIIPCVTETCAAIGQFQ